MIINNSVYKADIYILLSIIFLFPNNFNNFNNIGDITGRDQLITTTNTAHIYKDKNNFEIVFSNLIKHKILFFLLLLYNNDTF